jgi:alpha-glucosidase
MLHLIIAFKNLILYLFLDKLIIDSLINSTSMSKRLILLSAILMVSILLHSQVSIHIEKLSANTPEGTDIFFAGNINGWNPGDSSHLLEIRDDGDYWIDIPEGSGKVEFKFTRGSWDMVESNGNGGFRPNRNFTFGTVDTLHLEILGWEDLDGGGGGQSTANDQVQIWNESMEIPQLGRNRRIWVYLPKDYGEMPDKRYPVIYMHDGQNVFDASTSYAGEWEVDETLTSMEAEGYYGVIVVAIDNGGTHRIDEYSPFTNPQYGGGEGDAYLDFIIEILKPAIDSSFRTLDGPQNTGIMGSSMGGLISHYAHFRNPEVFGRAGILSPAYWFSSQYFSYTSTVGKTDSSRLFLLAGTGEQAISASTQQMYNLLVSMGFNQDEVKLKISQGFHNEAFWASEFRNIVEWLFPSEAINNIGTDLENKIKIFPNPSNGNFQIEGKGKMNVKIFGINGSLIDEYDIVDKGIISLDTHSDSLTVLVQISQNNTIRHKKMLIIKK